MGEDPRYPSISPGPSDLGRLRRSIAVDLSCLFVFDVLLHAKRAGTLNWGLHTAVVNSRCINKKTSHKRNNKLVFAGCLFDNLGPKPARNNSPAERSRHQPCCYRRPCFIQPRVIILANQSCLSLTCSPTPRKSTGHRVLFVEEKNNNG